MKNGNNSGETRKLRQIAFDLKIASLKEHYPKPEQTSNEQYYYYAYNDIRSFMENNGFEHRQGSVYDSVNKLTRTEVHSLVEKMARTMPWLYKCINKMDLTVVQTAEQDLTGFIKDATLDYLQHIEKLDVDVKTEDIDVLVEVEDYRDSHSLQELIDTAENVKETQTKVANITRLDITKNKVL